MLVNEERAGSARIDVAEIGSPGGGRRTAQADKGESERSNGGREARAWLRTKANSIEGGTSEVQLNIIAKRILELPGA